MKKAVRERVTEITGWMCILFSFCFYVLYVVHYCKKEINAYLFERKLINCPII